MKSKALGGALSVSAIGLGCVGMSAEYGSRSDWDESRSLTTLARAVELGVTLFDTADSYGPYTNELLLGKFIRSTRESITVSTKTGLVQDRATGHFVVNGRPEHIRSACEASLRRLGVDVIDLYYLHRIDPTVPLSDSWEAMLQLVRDGKVRELGICEANLEQVNLIHSIAPLCAVQSEFSLWTRDALPEMVPWCVARGIGFVPFSPLGRGFLTGTITSATVFAEGDIRANNPRFSNAAITANQAIVKGIRVVAERRGYSPAQVALAWVMAQGDTVVPIPGTKRVQHLEENVCAADVWLSEGEMAELAALPAPIGSRY